MIEHFCAGEVDSKKIDAMDSTNFSPSSQSSEFKICSNFANHPYPWGAKCSMKTPTPPSSHTVFFSPLQFSNSPIKNFTFHKMRGLA
jgi:hypothetical protein